MGIKVYTVHLPAGATDAARGAMRLVLVKDGFSWPALFFPLPWLLWQRMWWPALGWLAGAALVVAAGRLLPLGDQAAAVLACAYAVWFAFQANDMRRWQLAARGWSLTGLALGRSGDEAELGFLSRGMAPASTASVAAPGPARTGHGDPVIGLFPRPE